MSLDYTYIVGDPAAIQGVSASDITQSLTGCSSPKVIDIMYRDGNPIDGTIFTHANSSLRTETSDPTKVGTHEMRLTVYKDGYPADSV